LASGDGDALGGSVNLRTKTAGEQPTASVFGLAGYNPIIGGRHNTQYGATLGKRFGKEKKLGVLFGGTYDYNGRGIDDIEPGPQTIQCDPGNCGDPSSKAPDFATYAGTDLREYRYERVRWGMGGSVDYKISDSSNIYIRGLYLHFDNFGDRWVYSPTINSYGATPLVGGSDGNITFNAQIRRPVQTIGSLAMGGQRYFGKSIFTWEASGGRASTEDKGYTTANFGPVDDNSPLNNLCSVSTPTRNTVHAFPF